jgi:hypothetical protein
VGGQNGDIYRIGTNKKFSLIQELPDKSENFKIAQKTSYELTTQIYCSNDEDAIVDADFSLDSKLIFSITKKGIFSIFDVKTFKTLHR